MVEKTVTIQNRAGIHCRPSSAILLAAQEFPGCQLKVICAKGESEIDSILSLLGLGLEQGESVRICAKGKNEAAACVRLAELFANEFDFVQE